MGSVQPSDDEVLAFLTQVQEEHPDFGVKRVTSTLKDEHPTWIIGDKRVAKLMKRLGLTDASKGLKTSPTNKSSPRTKSSDSVDTPREFNSHQNTESKMKNAKLLNDGSESHDNVKAEQSQAYAKTTKEAVQLMAYRQASPSKLKMESPKDRPSPKKESKASASVKTPATSNEKEHLLSKSIPEKPASQANSSAGSDPQKKNASTDKDTKLQPTNTPPLYSSAEAVNDRPVRRSAHGLDETETRPCCDCTIA